MKVLPLLLAMFFIGELAWADSNVGENDFVPPERVGCGSDGFKADARGDCICSPPANIKTIEGKEVCIKLAE